MGEAQQSLSIAAEATHGSARPVPGAENGHLLAVDAVLVGATSVAICTSSHDLPLMTAIVAGAFAVRVGATVRKLSGRPLWVELGFLSLCTVLGGFNDWNSVVAHRVYDYAVPTDLAWSTIPAWMLAFWGLILRLLFGLGHFARLVGAEAGTIDDRVWLGRRCVEHGGARVTVMLLLVLATRQAIYRLYLDPVWSFVPFLLALAIYVAVLRPGPGVLRLMALFAVGGPIVEALYIEVGGLHRYALGWLSGVPLWIALWWVLAVVIWRELGARLLRLSAGRDAP